MCPKLYNALTTYQDFGSNSIRPIALPQTSAPTALVTHPTSPHHFMVAAQDGLIRLWDTRGTKSPVATFLGYPSTVAEGEVEKEKPLGKSAKKVICLDWGGKSGDLVLSGGEEGVCVSRASV